jgi:hypothetical protein
MRRGARREGVMDKRKAGLGPWGRFVTEPRLIVLCNKCQARHNMSDADYTDDIRRGDFLCGIVGVDGRMCRARLSSMIVTREVAHDELIDLQSWPMDTPPPRAIR